MRVPRGAAAAAVKHTTRALSGPPSTGPAIAMDGGVAEGGVQHTTAAFLDLQTSPYVGRWS